MQKLALETEISTADENICKYSTAEEHGGGPAPIFEQICYTDYKLRVTLLSFDFYQQINNLTHWTFNIQVPSKDLNYPNFQSKKYNEINEIICHVGNQ